MDLSGSAITDSTVIDEVSIVISQTGKVQTSPLYRAIDLDGDFNSITNYGEIVGGEAIRLEAGEDKDTFLERSHAALLALKDKGDDP